MAGELVERVKAGSRMFWVVELLEVQGLRT